MQDPEQPRGKQSSSGMPREIDYFCTTGIWQTVWLERLPATSIGSLRWTPNLERWEIGLEVVLDVLQHPRTGRPLIAFDTT